MMAIIKNDELKFQKLHEHLNITHSKEKVDMLNIL
jgi:hypothetical protein